MVGQLQKGLVHRHEAVFECHTDIFDKLLPSEQGPEEVVFEIVAALATAVAVENPEQVDVGVC